MTTATRPGGRSARIRADVHRATRELLAESPGETPTIPAVAARAGVHATTLYRRWGSVGELLGDVAASAFSGDVVVPDTGSLRGDLEHWVAGVAVDVADPDTLALIRAAAGTGTSGGCACVADRHAQLEAIFDREAGRGGAPPPVGTAADALLGPVYFRALFAPEPGGPEWARGLVAPFLAGFGQTGR